MIAFTLYPMDRRRVDVVVISDVHLGTYGCHAEELLVYLKSIKPGIIVLNGDIFDCWAFRRGYFPAAHMDVLRQIARFASKGVPVFYITGNHDDVFRRFSDLHLGKFNLVDQLILRIGGEQVLFFHGDAFDVSIRHSRWLAKMGGKGYDTLIRLNRLINRVLLRLGRPRISFSHRIKHSVKRAVRFIDDFEQAAADWGIAKGMDTVVCGHIHQPRMTRLKGRKAGTSIRYLNAGDWVENLTALEFHHDDWHLWQWKEDASFLPKQSSQQDKQEAIADAMHPSLSLLGQVAATQLLAEQERHLAKPIRKGTSVATAKTPMQQGL